MSGRTVLTTGIIEPNAATVTWDDVTRAQDVARIAYGAMRARPCPENERAWSKTQLRYEQMLDELRLAFAPYPLTYCGCCKRTTALARVRPWPDLNMDCGECPTCGTTLLIERTHTTKE